MINKNSYLKRLFVFAMDIFLTAESRKLGNQSYRCQKPYFNLKKKGTTRGTRFLWMLQICVQDKHLQPVISPEPEQLPPVN